MSILEFNKKVDNKEEKHEFNDLIKVCMNEIQEKGVEETHTLLGERYKADLESVAVLNEALFSIPLCVTLNNDEFDTYEEDLHELEYVMDLFKTTYDQAQNYDLLAVSLCTMLYTRVVGFINKMSDTIEMIETRWETGDFKNFEVAELLVKIHEALKIDEDFDDQFLIDYKVLTNAANSGHRYIIVNLNSSGILEVSTYNDRSLALQHIMRDKELSLDNLITRW